MNVYDELRNAGGITGEAAQSWTRGPRKPKFASPAGLFCFHSYGTKHKHYIYVYTPPAGWFSGDGQDPTTIRRLAAWLNAAADWLEWKQRRTEP